MRSALARHRVTIARWVLIPALAGATLAAVVDPASPPLFAPEPLHAVFLTDGQAYFGRLEDLPWSDVIVLRDVFYFQDSRGVTALPVALVRRGGELHRPGDEMRIRRDSVLAVERVGEDSAAAAAIAAQRRLDQEAR